MTNKPRTRMVDEYLGYYISFCELEGSFEHVIKTLQEYYNQYRRVCEDKNKWVEGVTTLQLQKGYPDYWSDTEVLRVYLRRPETDKERDEQLEEQRKREEREREQYERLKAKYENKV